MKINFSGLELGYTIQGDPVTGFIISIWNIFQGEIHAHQS